MNVRGFWLIATLIVGCFLLSPVSGYVVRDHPCNFETGLCGWLEPTRLPQGELGLTVASAAPPPGPQVDANPGTGDGTYYYFHTLSLSQSIQVLRFPSLEYVCGLSFAYYVEGPIDLGVLQENIELQYIATIESSWERESLSFNLSTITGEFGGIVFDVSELEFGEAIEDEDSELFLALDDVNVTFCLPCDYSILSWPGNLVLNAPSDFNVTLGEIHELVLEASSPICANATLVFAIEEVQPNHLLPIFSIDSQTGVVTVDGSGPRLDANGTSGTLNVSVHVVGSNYTHTSQPFRQTALISFWQPPTILVHSPHSISINVRDPFSYQTAAVSVLSTVPLIYSNLETMPEELVNDVTVDANTGEVSAMISVNTLDKILDLDSAPSISVRITDEYGGFLIHTVSLIIQESPPLFDESYYTFSIPENQTNAEVAGIVALIDPNDDRINHPFFTNDSAREFFLIVPAGQYQVGHFTQYEINSIHQLDYEQQTVYIEQIAVVDSVDPSLTATAVIRVNVQPVNEYSPVFDLNSVEVSISDVVPEGDIIAAFGATDSDHGLDGEVTYFISSGNEDRFFELISTSDATIRVRRSPILPRTYTLVITAMDFGDPPRSTDAVLVVNVGTTALVDCNEPDNGPPDIMESGGYVHELANTDITLYCHHTANPPVLIYKWVYIPPIPGDGNLNIFDDDLDNGQYTVEKESLTIHNSSAANAGFYQCNITNLCDWRTISYHLVITDSPVAPDNLRVTDGPYTESVDIAWDAPDQPEDEFVQRPLSGFVVQVKTTEERNYHSTTEVGADVTSVTVAGLLPGMSHDIRVMATNDAGETPSESIVVVTEATTPRLKYLTAQGLPNNSIQVEWEVEFNGGFPISEFKLAIEPIATRQRRQLPDSASAYLNQDQIGLGRYTTTESLQPGKEYRVVATLQNELGERAKETAAFVGYTDSVYCGFEGSGVSSCPWQLEEGSETRAEDVGLPLPSVDASGSTQGHYIYLSVGGSATEVVMTYTSASYVCGYSFYYQLYGDTELSLLTTLGEVVWTSEVNTTEWTYISTSQLQYLTGSLDEGLQFVLVTHNGGGYVTLDAVELQFCLPCDLEPLQREENFHLDYTNSTKIYLRIGQSLSLEAIVNGCEAAVVDFSIVRVVPSDLENSFSLVGQTKRSVNVAISPISVELAEPQTVGFVEVVVAITHSDYKLSGSDISRAALIEFVLVDTTENCSFSKECDFESGACDWSLGTGVQIASSETYSNTESYLYGEYSHQDTGSIIIASTIINDNYCAVSFSFSSNMMEIQVIVDGLGSVWSSLTLGGDGASHGWIDEAVLIDFESVGILENRSLSFEADVMEGFGDADVPAFFAVDNVTLHPCIDCSIPEVTPSSCLPGHYFSLAEEMCITCPAGYYCPDWREYPKPCPAGNYSTATGAVSERTCQSCPANTYTVQTGSSSCTPCPAHYTCTNSSSLPAPCPAGYSCPEGEMPSACPEGGYSFEGQGSCQSCPEGFSCPTASEAPVANCAELKSEDSTDNDVPMAAIVGGAVGGAVLLFLITVCCIAWCCWRKRLKAKTKNRRREREDYLLSGSRSGSQSTLDRSSVGGSSYGKRWTRSRGASTVLSFMTDDSSDPYCDESSWMDALKLTTPGESETLQNPAYEEEEEDMIELGDRETWKTSSKPTTPSASKF